MSGADRCQFIIRSSFARARARELAKLTGMTSTEVVEDALRSYVPPRGPKSVGRLVQRDALLILLKGGPDVTLEEANAELDMAREREV